MRYTSDEALSEILKRSEKIREKRRRRNERLLAGASGMLLIVLIVSITLLAGYTVNPATDSVMGSFLLSAEAGGYILVAVLAFALGIAVTFLCLKIRERNKDNPDTKEKEDGK